MFERSEWINKLIDNYNSRVAYTKSKVSVNIASQIKALRRRRGMTQKELGQETVMKQSRISTMECPGATSLTLDTLSRLASAFKVGLIVKFVPYSEMLQWENIFSQDTFDAVIVDKDMKLQYPEETFISTSYTYVYEYIKQPSDILQGYTTITEGHEDYNALIQGEIYTDKDIVQNNAPISPIIH